MLSDEQRTTAIDAAAAAALAEIDDATDDADERDMLWQPLVGGTICATMSGSTSGWNATAAAGDSCRADSNAAAISIALD